VSLGEEACESQRGLLSLGEHLTEVGTKGGTDKSGLVQHRAVPGAPPEQGDGIDLRSCDSRGKRCCTSSVTRLVVSSPDTREIRRVSVCGYAALRRSSSRRRSRSALT
jgi:hypothetical protein